MGVHDGVDDHGGEDVFDNIFEIDDRKGEIIVK